MERWHESEIDLSDLGARSSGIQYIQLSLIQEHPCLPSQKKRKKEERQRVTFHEAMPFATTWMDLEIIIPSGINQREKDKHRDISYSRNLKYDTNEPIYGKETDSQTQRTDLWLPNRRGVGEGWTESLG